MNAIAPLFRAIPYSRFVLFLFFVLSFHYNNLSAQAPPIEWNRTLGGSNWEELNTLLPLQDGIIFGGTTQSLGWTLPVNQDFYTDFTLFKLDMDGKLLWHHAYGGLREERLWAIAEAQDGNILIGGHSDSDVEGNKTAQSQGGRDFWLVKTDKNGKKLWDRAYGGSGTDELYSILPLTGGDILLTGISDSPISGHKTEASRGSNDLWIIRIDADGNVLWDKTIGGSDNDRLSSYRSVQFAEDGNVVIAGTTGSLPNSGDISDDVKFGNANPDFWLVKINPNTGQMLWNHRYGGSLADLAYGVMLSRDKKYYFMWGESMSDSLPTTQVLSAKKSPYLGALGAPRSRDFWLIKVGLDGIKMPEFDRTFGGTGDDGLYDVNENLFGDLILGGYSDSPKAGGLGDHDWKIFCIDKFGKDKWSMALGGSGLDALTKVERLPDGSLVFIGHSNSDIGPNKSEAGLGKNDFYIVKTGCNVKAKILDYPSFDPCSGEPLSLEIQASNCDDCLYYWDIDGVGQVGRYYEVQPGESKNISILVADEQACIGMDTGFYSVHDPVDFTLGIKDTSILASQSIQIGGNNPKLQYKWNTSDTAATLVVSFSGVYTVTVTDENGCSATDWVMVRSVKKDAVYIPNVFTPDFDGSDDYFNVYTDYSVRKILTLQVYDRWGAQLFKHDNYTPNYEADGWDGIHKGRRMPPGGYKYVAVVEYIDGEKEVFEGIVAIIR